MGLWVRGRLNSHRALLVPTQRNKIKILLRWRGGFSKIHYQEVIYAAIL